MYGRNLTARAVPPASFASMLELQAARIPDAIAVVDETACVSYRTLDARANRLAAFLLERGVKVEQRVCVALGRSIDWIVSVFGIAKAGGVYVPLDPDYPERRLELILRDAAPVCVLTTSEQRLRLPRHPELITADDWDEAGSPLSGSQPWGTPTSLVPIARRM